MVRETSSQNEGRNGKENAGKMKKTAVFLIGSFLLFIVLFFAGNFPLIRKAFPDQFHSVSDLRSRLTEAFKSDDFFLRDALITLNGGYARLSGRRFYNNVILLKNGYLTQPLSTGLDAERTARIYEDLENFAASRGGDFLYVQLPYKLDTDGALLPDGLEDYGSYGPTEGFVEALRERGTDVIDTIPDLCRDREEIGANYYRTDHHWKPSAAYKAFRMIMAHLDARYPGIFPDEPYLHEENWEFHELPGQFLGSLGKRVGSLYAGLDSLEWMTPRFETELSFYVPEEDRFSYGSYEDAFIRQEYLEAGGSRMHTNHYEVYTGGDHAMTQSRNLHAPADMKLLLIEDSYMLPLKTFFAMAFREVDAIDPRTYRDSSVYEYIDRTRPDLVITALTPGSFEYWSYFHYNDPGDIYAGETRELLFEGDVPIGTGTEYSPVSAGFEDRSLYELSFTNVSGLPEGTDAVSAVLYDSGNETAVSEMVFDVRYCGAAGNCRWSFETPEGCGPGTELRLSAGDPGPAGPSGPVFEGVRLYRTDPVNAP